MKEIIEKLTELLPELQADGNIISLSYSKYPVGDKTPITILVSRLEETDQEIEAIPHEDGCLYVFRANGAVCLHTWKERGRCQCFLKSQV